jgi:hypothetical protein
MQIHEKIHDGDAAGECHKKVDGVTELEIVL